MMFFILLILHDRVVVIRSSLVQSVYFVEVVPHVYEETEDIHVTNIYSFKLTSYNMSSSGERKESAVF